MSKYYTELDEYKSENNRLKTKIKRLEEDLAVAKELINNTHEINIELTKKVEQNKRNDTIPYPIITIDSQIERNTRNSILEINEKLCLVIDYINEKENNNEQQNIS